MPHLTAALRRPELYGISGRKGHGKDTFANLIVEAASANHKASVFHVTHFAASLKRIAGRVFGLSEAQLHDPVLKAATLEVPLDMDLFLGSLRAETGLDLQPAGKIAHSPRELMQFIGTDYVRKARPDYWISRLLADTRNTRKVLVPDTRFPNEAEALRQKGGLIIKVVRIDLPRDSDGHASETEIDNIEPDLLIGVRTGDLSLPKKVAQLISLNKFAGALRYDYRKAQEAISAYVGGMSIEETASGVLGVQNPYPLWNILDYYGIPERQKSRRRVPHQDINGYPHKLCCYCKDWVPLSEFNASTKSWDGHAQCCRSCASDFNKRNYEKHAKTESLLSIYNTSKRFAPRRGLAFTLSFEDIQRLWDGQGGCCWYSGVEMTTERNSLNKITFDRINSAEGYVCGNVVLCTITANLMKKDMSVEVFRDWVGRIHQHLAAKVTS